ncbi:chorismate lyase [Kingella negevensis]|uniref:chorismate--pyruvate lyase family protein n=1 Tax=Kingella negevensis TaxID=1522312 RepID=UPI0025435123|nr:chorismate lyase [Kingella negevensis]MDK4679773.1 chorismate lyase [Kingella negevensis]MDK4682509.1 chorismate lyase [Kingella negevensis]MDK4690705.1 chorismate lyase [Kingella negevensis]MDK4694147.1 chorismate lyase [Kingella negevensis]MDK4699876.1 chorismate lyase [Kingella negevensis]
MTWQQNYPQQAEKIKHLATASSLTAALSDLNATFSVKLLALGETQNSADFTDFRLSEMLFQREVLLCLDGIPVVHAQSICAADSAWREILNCGTLPLGKILFSGSLKGLTRSEITFRLPENDVVSRRSWFEWQGERLYLVEHFLPEILQFNAA